METSILLKLIYRFNKIYPQLFIYSTELVEHQNPNCFCEWDRGRKESRETEKEGLEGERKCVCVYFEIES